ncbi:hypothetical protein [Shinella sp.]|uniref:hypothetical protein n=1 Tax=Shinella sp. TaxID=1870904 RepID=UPI003F703F7D
MTEVKDRKDFSGALAEPITASDADSYLTQALGKVPQLLAHYGIAEYNDDGSRNDLLLALALCRDFVPGFQPPRKETRGRKRKGLAEKVDLLDAAGKALLAHPNYRMNAIASLVAKEMGENARTLENEIPKAAREISARVQALLAKSQKK